MGYREECEKLYIENKEMKAKLTDLLNGYKGACHTCELVGKVNKEMRNLIDWLWENEPEKTEMLDKIQEYLENKHEN